MSFKLKGFKRKFKESFNKNLNKLAFKVNDAKHRGAWHVLITGGAGHLAENLTNKLVENVRDELRPEIVEMLESEKQSGNGGQRIRKRILMKRIELEISNRLPEKIRIILLDLVEPKEEILQNEYVTFIKGSFTDFEVMKTALDNVETVFHLAAVGMTGQFARDRKSCMDINAVGTMNLLSWCRQKGVQRFIYSSSVGVIFNGDPLNNCTEDVEHPDKFYNYYCESKAHAEKIVQNASCPELKTTVLRFNGIYGPGEKRVTERVVAFMLSGWWIGICRPNGQEAQTQLSSVDNCVQGLVKAELTLRQTDSKHAQIYNIMDRHPVGTFTFWSPLNKALGFTEKMIDIPPFFLRTGGFLCQHLSDFFGFDPFMTSLEVDLLITNNTFCIDKAIKEIGYDPLPSPMPEIVEMYQNGFQSPDIKAHRKQHFMWKVTMLVILIILICVIFFACALQFVIFFSNNLFIIVTYFKFFINLFF